jgi:hypothetical protein
VGYTAAINAACSDEFFLPTPREQTCGIRAKIPQEQHLLSTAGHLLLLEGAAPPIPKGVRPPVDASTDGRDLKR